MAKDYYEILGVSKNASQDEIQAAYRRLVMQYHPDINKAPDATKKMAEINEAYDTLSDPEKRRKYDMYGQAGAGADFGSQQAYYNREDFGDFFSGGGFGGSIFDDLINSLGGTIKIGEALTDFSLANRHALSEFTKKEIIKVAQKNNVGGKFNFGFSFYGSKKLPGDFFKLALAVKKDLKNFNI